MSGFSAAWLGLREPADHAARSVALSLQVADYLAATVADVSPRSPLRVLDLATGTGSNPRYLSRYLPSPQVWTVLDADAQLLSEVPTRMAAWASRAGGVCVQGGAGVTVTCAGTDMRLRPQTADISRFPLAALAERPALVTAAALLDLVSEPWLAAIASACRHVDAAVLFALTYDGRMKISPGHADDELVLRLVNRHQRSDKGFGTALGPDATATAAAQFEAAGYDVRREPSDWVIGPGERRLQGELIAGWARAACEMDSGESERLRTWERERGDAAAVGGIVIVVGHEDLAAWPRA